MPVRGTLKLLWIACLKNVDYEWESKECFPFLQDPRPSSDFHFFWRKDRGSPGSESSKEYWLLPHRNPSPKKGKMAAHMSSWRVAQATSWQGSGRTSSPMLLPLESVHLHPLRPGPAQLCCSGEVQGLFSWVLQLVIGRASSHDPNW